MRLREALTRATQQLEAISDLREDAGRDAALLLRYALGITQAAMLADPDRLLTSDQEFAYDAMILRRAANEPIQYITGEQEFYGLTLRVTRDVLIPRPETEILVEAVLEEVKRARINRGGNENQLPFPAESPGLKPHSSWAPIQGAQAPCSLRKAEAGIIQQPQQPALRILDVGTGSGAIVIALAHHLSGAQLVAVDISVAALKVAAANAARHAVAEQIQFIESDLQEGLAGSEAEYDVIVSNPPYVPVGDRASLHPQVREYEPEAALFAGADGLDIYRRLIPQARAALRPSGLLAMEIGYGQKDAVAELLSGWNEVRFVDDLQRIPRVVLARRQ